MEFKQSRLKSQNKPNRFLDNSRYKRVGDVTDPKTLVRPAFISKEPVEPLKRSVHDLCCGVDNQQMNQDLLPFHQRQPTHDSEGFANNGIRGDRSVGKSGQRRSTIDRYSHIMPRVYTGRGQLNANIHQAQSKETMAAATSSVQAMDRAANANTIVASHGCHSAERKSVKNLTRLKSANPNRKKNSMQLE